MRPKLLPSVLLATVIGLLGSPAASASAAPAAYDPDTVIVKYRSFASDISRQALSDRLGVGATVGKVRRLGALVVRVEGDPARVARRLQRSPLVAYAEPDYLLSTFATPDDPRFDELYGLHNTGQTGGSADADIDAPEGWDAAGLGGFPGTGGTKVGIVDTGIQTGHPDLGGKVADCAQSRGLLGLFGGSIQEGSCSDDNGHGTHVAGTISANADNGAGVAGVAFSSPLTVCRALGGLLGIGNTSDVANCITWSHDQGAEVISMSLGGGDSTTLENAVDYAWDGGDGSVLVAAAGNDGNSTVNYPAGYDNVVSVAATDHDDERASFSNANADVEIAAPGVDILSTYNNGGYTTLSGTSMATPHVAGVAAVIRDLHPTDSATGVVDRLDAATDDLGPAGRDPEFGFGRVNLQKAATG